MSIFHQFSRDRSGTFSTIAAFMAVPLALAVGLAVDYTNVLRIKTKLQNSVDSAALAVASQNDQLNDSQAHSLADSFIDGNFNRVFTTVSVARAGQTVEVTANTQVKLAFGGVFGMGNAVLTASTKTEVSYANYEIALALDTTGSMAGGKLASMKEAVTGMIDTMVAQNAGRGLLKFSIVPFSSMVNVGSQFGPAYDAHGAVTRQPAAWLDGLAKSPIDQSDLDPGVSRFALYKHLGMQWPGCVEHRPTVGGVDYGITDIAPNSADPKTLYIPAFASDEPGNSGFPNSYLPDMGNPIGSGTAAGRMARYGAVYDSSIKTMTFNQQIAASAAWSAVSPDFSNQNYYGSYSVNKGPDFGCDVQPIMALTGNYPALKAKVNSLAAQGSTNIIEGAAWGWRTLSPQLPFSEGKPYNNTGTRKILVLLTDGSNNLGLINNALGSAYNSYGYLVDGRLGLSSGSRTQVTDAMNDRTLAVCANAKAEGIEIYTIKLEEPDVVTGTMLRDCASGADHYFDVPNRTLLDDAFAKIKDKIEIVRIIS
ncbi:MAG: pilus assembly protein [Rhizobiaceae bacterium]